ncbi:S-adenosyl-L-methionine-dependent methyltransferase [Boletus edulis BED1]|uniref:S-adenosyl-L-methionine-dependent methyltransferase n=1 Tax=Boletus edulis BED1 TaxID=1328754 RepID=A0AAD4BN24_BOLED|nr:S-adenosyl-L-methionine-dependent methyltransferase [Boletus edulis BED1]
MHNERFTAYYKAQNIISEDEWDTFMDSLRRPLPTTFRIAGSRQIAQTLGNTIKDTYIPLLHNVTFEGEVIPPPSQIPWYPDGLAWQFNVSKQVLRTSPEFKKFRSFLVHETEVGNISRQEAVSMLPPLLLDVQPHHKVMDMCAAPGSKTAQLLEALHANDTATATSTPPGLLIANDSDSRRAHLLIHQSARLPSPSFMVTNLDASIYPILRSMTPEKHRSVKKTPSQLLFDRILCDVPCSGDGTLRKNVGIWKRWQPLDGNGLHSLQVRILQRAMRMLEPNGRIVYSTCSLNPIENEAVIAAALNSHPEFDLVDVSSQLPELIRRPGVTHWSPTVGRSIDTSHPSWAAYIETVPEDNRAESKMFETHWPPSNAETLNLERCIRIYPHLQDTGGFFVAVLERKESHGLSRRKQEGKRAAEEADMTIPEGKKLKLETNVSPNEPGDAPSASTSSVELINAIDDAATIVEDAPTTEQSHTAATAQTSKPRVADPSFKEMPYTLVSPDDPALVTCMQQLHLSSDFPTSNVLVRNPEGDAVRSLYLVNDFVKSVLAHNDYTRMRLMTAGTKVITKQEAGRGMDAHFRILGEGLPVVLPYIDPATIMMADLKALKVLLQTYYPLCISFQEPFRSAIEARGSGSHVVRFLASQSADADTTLLRDLVLPLWKSNVSVTLMVDKKVKSALSLRLFGEDVTIAAREASKKKLLAGTSAATQHDTAEPGSEHEDEDGEVKDENDDMDIEEQEQ